MHAIRAKYNKHTFSSFKYCFIRKKSKLNSIYFVGLQEKQIFRNTEVQKYRSTDFINT